MENNKTSRKTITRLKWTCTPVKMPLNHSVMCFRAWHWALSRVCVCVCDIGGVKLSVEQEDRILTEPNSVAGLQLLSPLSASLTYLEKVHINSRAWSKPGLCGKLTSLTSPKEMCALKAAGWIISFFFSLFYWSEPRKATSCVGASGFLQIHKPYTHMYVWITLKCYNVKWGW